MTFSCSKKEETPPNETVSQNKILPLGASRVQGSPPTYDSFRYELWKKLVDGGWDFDFIGTIKDQGIYPDYNSQSFDPDHEGRAGWTSGQILTALEDGLATIDTPDFVLFSSPGGNDLLLGVPYDDIMANVNAIIDVLQDANPEVTIILEQMAPIHSDLITQPLAAYLNQVHRDIVTVVSQQTTKQSRVLTVNMFTGFTDEYLADNLHYNSEGAAFVAQRYYDVLSNILKK